MGSSKECWGYASSEHPDKWQGCFSSRNEAIVEACDTLDSDSEVWVIRGERFTVDDLVPSAVDVVEMMAVDAVDNYGDITDDWPSVTKKGVRMLDELLSMWAARYVDEPMFWLAVGKPERIDRCKHAVANQT